jgi:hypothetical protein
MISFGQHVLARGAASRTALAQRWVSATSPRSSRARRTRRNFPPPLGRTDPSQLFPDSAPGVPDPNMRKRAVVPADAGDDIDHRARWRRHAGGAGWLVAVPPMARRPERRVDLRPPRSDRAVRASRTSRTRPTRPSRGCSATLPTAVFTDSIPGVARTAVPARLRLTSRNLRQIFMRFSDIDTNWGDPALSVHADFV